MRPATYESAEEAKVLSHWFSGRDGDLENTTFVLLDPSGQRALSRGGRSPGMVFGDKENFIAKLNEQAGKFKPNKADASLPTVTDLRLGLNIAASDGLPLVAIVEEDARKRDQLQVALAEAYAKESIAGQAHFVVLHHDAALAAWEGYASGKSMYILQPDTFARSAKVVVAFSAGEKKLAAKLEAALSTGRIDKASHRDHVRQGRRAGIGWKSAIPVSDGAATSREGGGRRGRRDT